MTISKIVIILHFLMIFIIIKVNKYMYIYFTGGRPKNLPVFEQAEKAVQKRVHLFRNVI